MKTSTLQLLKELDSDKLRLLEALEADSELRPGFVDDLIRDLVLERYQLSKSMLAVIPTPTTSSSACPAGTSLAIPTRTFAASSPRWSIRWARFRR